MNERWQNTCLWKTLEIFRFEDKVFSHIFKKSHSRKLYVSFFFFFTKKKLALLSLLKEVKPSPACKIIKPLTFDNLFNHYDILA